MSGVSLKMLKAVLRKINAPVFIDEIHRFNKAQQDALLPAIEKGIVRLTATTENPSFALNAALLSRASLAFDLPTHPLAVILTRAETFLKRVLPLDDKARDALIAMADGDGRYLLNMVEKSPRGQKEMRLDATSLAGFLTKKALNYDKSGDQHYNLISALHKSLRASDCDAAFYWLARMLAGEDAHYIARRLLRLPQKILGWQIHCTTTRCRVQSYERLGSPEGICRWCRL